MKKKLFVGLFVGLFFVVLVVGAGFISSKKVGDYNISSVEDCVDVLSFSQEALYSSCNVSVVRSICSDVPLNLSCSDVTEVFFHECFTGFQTVEKNTKSCKDKSYDVGSNRLNVDGFKCSFNQEGGSLVAVCDSLFDGNGDGICQSGESCQKFVINGNSVEKFEKNSRDDFVKDDDSFVINGSSVEVLQ